MAVSKRSALDFGPTAGCLWAAVLAILILSSPVRAAVPLHAAKAEACYHQLIAADSPAQTDIIHCLQMQQDLFRHYAASAAGAKYLFRLGRLNTLLYRVTAQPSVLEEAIDSFRRLINRYPLSSLADDAQYHIGQIFLDLKKDEVNAYAEFLKVEIKFPHGDMVPQARQRLRSLGRQPKTSPQGAMIKSAKTRRGQEDEGALTPKLESEPPQRGLDAADENQDAEQGEADKMAPPLAAPPGEASVTGLRHWSTVSYTRVVVDVTGAVKFSSHMLRPDPEVGKPARLYVDLEGVRLGDQGEQMITIADGHLRQARMGQFDRSTVRVVLDIVSIDGYHVFALSSPERVVIDVTGPKTAAAKTKPEAKPAKVPRGPAQEEAGPSIAKALGLGVRTVVIDPGHGGRDPGARTCYKALREKKITLIVARHLAAMLKKKLGVKVVMTRDRDVFVPLEERTAIANTSNADLFISIHVNAARDKRLCGVETYFLNLASDERAIDLAARENATTTKSISDLQSILNDLLLNTKINESNRLAFQIQRSLIRHLEAQYEGVRSLGVKQAPFYVLLGAQMPAILIEIGFGTNKTDCRRLATESYLKEVAQGIAKGIEAYIVGTGGAPPIETRRLRSSKEG